MTLRSNVFLGPGIRSRDDLERICGGLPLFSLVFFLPCFSFSSYTKGLNVCELCSSVKTKKKEKQKNGLNVFCTFLFANTKKAFAHILILELY